MKIGFLFLLILLSSCQPDNPLHQVDDFGIPLQTYPSKQGNYCYHDIVSFVIRDNIPLSYSREKTTIENIKKTTVVDSLGDKQITGYDKYRNITSYKRDSTKYDYRYKFNPEGQVSSAIIYLNNTISKECFFSYDKKGRIIEVLTDIINHRIDTAYFQYDLVGNVVKTKFKELFYDERGNCIEWTSTEGSCGHSTHQWKGTYNEKDSLISEWIDNQELFSELFKFELPNYTYKEKLDSLKRVVSEEVFEEDSLVVTRYYEYY